MLRSRQDGALPDGTPIAGRLYELYGVGFMLPYMLCLLFAFFGIFNLMTALFVESVMDAAKQKQQVMAGPERLRIAQKLRELILRFSGQQAPEKRCRGVHRSFRPRDVAEPDTHTRRSSACACGETSQAGAGIWPFVSHRAGEQRGSVRFGRSTAADRP